MDTLTTANLLRPLPSDRDRRRQGEDDYYRKYDPSRRRKRLPLGSLAALPLLFALIDQLPR